MSLEYLGFGQITFQIEDPEDGAIKTFHRIQYSNSNENPSLGNPSLNFLMRSEREATASSNSFFVESASCAGFIEGRLKLLGSPETHLLNINTTLLSGGIRPVLFLRNAATFRGETNRAVMYPRSVSFSTDGNLSRPLDVRFYANAAISGGTVANAYGGDTTSPAEVNTTQITSITTPGRLVGSISGKRGTSTYLDISEFEAFILPGESFLMTVQSNNDIDEMTATVSWVVDM